MLNATITKQCGVPERAIRALAAASCLAAAVYSVLASTGVVAAATISGTVILPSNHGVRSSMTIHDLSTPRTAGQKPFDHRFPSKSDGTFTLTGVPAGKYRICVEAPQANVLDPCLWSATQPTWTVAAADLANIAIRVQVGTQLKVHVNDPQSALPAVKGGVHGEALQMVVMTNQKRYHHLRLLSSSAGGGSDHYAIVPFDETLTLVTQSAM